MEKSEQQGTEKSLMKQSARFAIRISIAEEPGSVRSTTMLAFAFVISVVILSANAQPHLLAFSQRSTPTPAQTDISSLVRVVSLAQAPAPPAQKNSTQTFFFVLSSKQKPPFDKLRTASPTTRLVFRILLSHQPTILRDDLRCE